MNLAQMNLIRLLDFYLLFIFVCSTGRRLSHYGNLGRVAAASPGRWPHLLRLFGNRAGLLLTWSTIVPALLALSVCIGQLTASRCLFSTASAIENGLTLKRLAEVWQASLIAVPLAGVMLTVDMYLLLQVPSIDRVKVERALDQAEFWLRSPAAHFVKVATLGRINPRRQVAIEVGKAIHELNRLLNNTFCWTSLQIGVRLAVGFSLWFAWLCLI